MGINTVPQPPYSQDLAACDFCLFPKLTGCRYETIEKMKEAVTKVDTLTQEDFHGIFQKLLEQYNKCIGAGGDNFEGDKSFMCVLSIKVPLRKKAGNLFNDPRACVCVYIYIYIYTHIFIHLRVSLSFLVISNWRDIYIYIYIYIYTHTHTHTHIPNRSLTMIFKHMANF